jgi:hypothetical protein
MHSLKRISQAEAELNANGNVFFRHSFDPFRLPSERISSVRGSQMDELQAMGFTSGLAETINENIAQFPLRIWIVDNSASMRKEDGSRILTKQKGGYTFGPCSRWKEMKQTVIFHAEMAEQLKAPTIFRLMNRPMSSRLPREFEVGKAAASKNMDLAAAKDTLSKVFPKGSTPLTKRIKEIQMNILQIERELRRRGERVVVVIATDGLPTNREGECTPEVKQDFEKALRSLVGLSVWIVIRLCTQKAGVVDFYNELDRQFELSLEVLDDVFEEAMEVYNCNKWINYGLPLHRAREMGFHHRLFDLLDERELTLDEMKACFSLLFGKRVVERLPDPTKEWKAFLKEAKKIVDSAPKAYNPICRKETPWIDMKKLAKAYQKRNACVLM